MCWQRSLCARHSLQLSRIVVILFSVLDVQNDEAVPVTVLMNGDGTKSKGFKTEWATVKDNVLYVGSMGKEWTNNDGVLLLPT